MTAQIVVVEGKEGKERDVGMGIQRRVRMGNYGELGSPYILNPYSRSHDVYLCLFGYSPPLSICHLTF